MSDGVVYPAVLVVDPSKLFRPEPKKVKGQDTEKPTKVRRADKPRRPKSDEVVDTTISYDRGHGKSNFRNRAVMRRQPASVRR